MLKDSTTKKRRRTKPAEERLDDLVEAARKVFTARGVQDATVEEITEAAGVSKGTFYLYFKSKEHAVSVLWERYIDKFLAAGERVAADDGGDILERIVVTFERLSEYVLDNADLHLLFYRRAEDDVRRRANERLFMMITDMVRDGVAAGQLTASNPDLLVRILFHGMGGAMHDAIESGKPIPRDEIVRTSGELVRMTFAPARTVGRVGT